MFSKKVTFASLTLAMALSSAYTALANDKDHAVDHKGYFKPGTAVALTYDYDGQTQPGELEYITLTVEHFYSEGFLSARLLDAPNLDITSYSDLENQPLQVGSSLKLPIQVSSLVSGEHFISLEIIHESLTGEHTLRVLSLPIQIGSSKTSKNAPLSAQKSKASKKKGLITMAAQETIK
jgi:hypothetical protein